MTDISAGLKFYVVKLLKLAVGFIFGRGTGKLKYYVRRPQTRVKNSG